MNDFTFMPPRRPDPEFPKRLKALRIRRGLSRSGLGRAAAVSNTCVMHWEAGDTYPRPENFVKLASALATTREWLSWGEGTTDLAADLAVARSAEEKAEPIRRTLPDPAVVQRHRQAIAAETGYDAAEIIIVFDLGGCRLAV